MPQDDKFLDVEECAGMLKMSTRFLYDQLRRGGGPRFRRFGNRYRIRLSELMRWAASAPKSKGH